MSASRTGPAIQQTSSSQSRLVQRDTPASRTPARTQQTSGNGLERTRTNPADVEKGGILPTIHRRDDERAIRRFWTRFTGKNRARVPTWGESLVNVATASWLNVLLVFLPLAWISHFLKWNQNLTFALSLVAIIPLEKLFDYGGENFALYCGQSLGDLVIISLDNVVEAALAIILLTKCELRLAQSTIVGVVILHLLLVPGVAFLVGGAKVLHQHLDPHVTELNQALLTIGVLALLIPAAFFAAIGQNVATTAETSHGSGSEGTTEHARRALGHVVSLLEGDRSTVDPVSDESRHNFLRLSRGIAIMLLVVYIGSRIYLHNPPGEGNALQVSPNAPKEVREKEEEAIHEEPKMNPWSCLLLFAITIPLTAATAEWLVDSLEHVRETSGIKQEWFGLILLPLVSFAAEALVTIIYFIRTVLFLKPETPDLLAKSRAMDLSIQFTLFWMPFLILLAWWTNKPLFLLFDLFEVAIVIGVCFLVNTITDDSKTNWAEGLILISFYVMIATASWFYDGQQPLEQMLFCRTVAEVVAGGE